MRSIIWPGITFSMPVSFISNHSCKVAIFIIICQNLFHPKYSQCSCNPQHICIANNQTPQWNRLKNDDQISVNHQLQTFFFHHRTHFWWWRRVMMIYICSNKCFIFQPELCIKPLQINWQNHVGNVQYYHCFFSCPSEKRGTAL